VLQCAAWPVRGGSEELHVWDANKAIRIETNCEKNMKPMLLFSDLTNQVETIGLKLQKVTAEMDHYKKLLT